MGVAKVNLKAHDAHQQFVDSLHHTGFAVLENHPIDVALIHKVYEDWRAFFASEEKHQYLFTKEDQDGFYPMSVSEKAKGYDVKDIKEFYHFYPWGRQPELIGPETQQLYQALLSLAGQCLRWIDHFTPDHVRAGFSMPLNRMIKNSQRTLLRILHYPPLLGDEQEGAVRAAAHGDINLITLLPAATDTGLQMQDKKGRWVDIPSDDGAIIVNIADMLEMASDHYYPSTIHRVVNPTGAAAERSRLSLPLFLHARPEVVLSPEYTAEEFWQERLREIGHL